MALATFAIGTASARPPSVLISAFFPVPGMAHCGGGSGTSTFDALAAPRSVNGRVDRTRPLCAYPAVARYKGAGSIDDAANFVCTP